jgi:DNA repair protein RadD
MLALQEKPKPITLRWYQQDAVDSVFRIWNEDEEASPLIVIPTGGGKSLTLAEICRRFIAAYPGKRILSIVHVRELVGQNYMSFRKTAPDISAGIFSASLGRKDSNALVTFGTVQSVVRALERFRNVGLILIDEAHLVPHTDDGQYRAVIKGIREMNPDCKVVGCTATPWRMNSGNLCEPHGDAPALFTEVAFELSVLQLLREGYLCPAVAKPTKVYMSTDGVKKKGGEFSETDLDKKLNNDKLNGEIVADIVPQIADRRSVLVFAVSVDHAERLRDHFRRYGISAEAVSGETPPATRDNYLQRFKRGQIKVLTNCAVLTTGFDAPETDCVIFCRPTNSPGLYLQMAGRGLRIAEGKSDCLMLDYAGNVVRHGLVDMVKGVFKRGKRQKEPDASDELKLCVACGTFLSRETKVCHACGQEVVSNGMIQDRESKLFKQQTAGKIATQREELQEFSVEYMQYFKHQSKQSGTPMLKLRYTVHGEPFPIDEFLLFDHKTEDGAPAWPAKKARTMWRRLTTQGKPPLTVDEAIGRIMELRKPAKLWARKDGSFWRVEGFAF